MDDRHRLGQDLFLPVVLFGALGGMTWAVRGSSGFGAAAGCIFAGVTLGTAWWFIARDPSGTQSRRYASGWIILAMTVAFGIAGTRGWMQWPHFFNERLYTDYRAGEFVPISRTYGFVWLFLAGIPWAGMGACFLAWCASGRKTAPWLWLVRLACGFGFASVLGVLIYNRYPHVFLPFYERLHDQYQDLEANPNLKKLVRDNREAMLQMGLYLGFLAFEIARRDWKNVTLIGTVGLLNGIGWSLLQNWMWADDLWPNAQFNFWRCWETSGGITIGIAYGVAYYLVNGRMSDTEIAAQASRANAGPPGFDWLVAYLLYAVVLGFLMLEVMPWWSCDAFTLVVAAFGIGYYLMAPKESETAGPLWSVDSPILERWGAYTGLILGLGLSVKNGLKGWANIHLGNEGYWNDVFWMCTFPVMLLALIGLTLWLLRRRAVSAAGSDPFPHAYAIVWLVVIVQNVIAQLVTFQTTNWQEMAFSAYYFLLFLITAAVIRHYHLCKAQSRTRGAG